jgi:hypothetical protein
MAPFSLTGTGCTDIPPKSPCASCMRACTPLPPQVITPTTDCFDHRLDSQVCEDAGVKASYYFYNITNHEEVGAGAWHVRACRC